MPFGKRTYSGFSVGLSPAGAKRVIRRQLRKTLGVRRKRATTASNKKAVVKLNKAVKDLTKQQYGPIQQIIQSMSVVDGWNMLVPTSWDPTANAQALTTPRVEGHPLMFCMNNFYDGAPLWAVGGDASGDASLGGELRTYMKNQWHRWFPRNFNTKYDQWKAETDETLSSYMYLPIKSKVDFMFELDITAKMSGPRWIRIDVIRQKKGWPGNMVVLPTQAFANQSASDVLDLTNLDTSSGLADLQTVAYESMVQQQTEINLPRALPAFMDLANTNPIVRNAVNPQYFEHVIPTKWVKMTTDDHDPIASNENAETQTTNTYTKRVQTSITVPFDKVVGLGAAPGTTPHWFEGRQPVQDRVYCIISCDVDSRARWGNNTERADAPKHNVKLYMKRTNVFRDSVANRGRMSETPGVYSKIGAQIGH